MRVTTMIVCDDEVDGGGGEAAIKWEDIVHAALSEFFHHIEQLERPRLTQSNGNWRFYFY